MRLQIKYPIECDAEVPGLKYFNQSTIHTANSNEDFTGKKEINSCYSFKILGKWVTMPVMQGMVSMADCKWQACWFYGSMVVWYGASLWHSDYFCEP